MRTALVSAVLLATVAWASDRPVYKSTFEYTQKTGKLWGVCEVVVNQDGTVTFVDAEGAGYGAGLFMSDAEEKPVTQVALKPKQFFRLSDGHHAFLRYELNAVSPGGVEVSLLDAFDARSFGGEVKKATKTIEVKPYRDTAEGLECPEAEVRPVAEAAAIPFEKATVMAAAGKWREAVEHARECLRASRGHVGCAGVLKRASAQCKNLYMEGYQLIGTRPDEALKLFREVMAICPAGDESHERAKLRIENLKN